ncbi:MAG: substrate-binding domain-containing protein [Opitutaceae bacterium]|jgi:DNA-binding LacI/PurR family transcriptional regulator|nr:substrate-binding domain-containing protein [Opitutaceae bacterium]
MPLTYQSISTQVANTIRGELNAGTWRGVLPGERQLSERLGVSRKTIRKALAMLRAEGVVRTERGRASAPVQRPGKARREPGPVTRAALLLPGPIEGARPFTVLWVNHLMTLLHHAGMELEIMAGWRYFGQNAAQSLQKLVDTHPGRCWLLARSHRPLQEWFAASGRPALVAGSTHEGVELPCVDIDHRALCRHAALAFMREGHRRLVLFLEKIGHGGDLASEQGFRDGIAGFENAEAPLVCRPAKGAAPIVRELRRILALRPAPTGFLLSNSFSYLTVLSYLASQGLRVPRDVSLISRDEEPFLPYLHPAPTRYSAPPAKFATALYQAIKRVIEQGAPRRFDVRIMPDFIKGGTVAPRTGG